MSAATLVWFRQDLRLADHPALVEAVRRGGPVVPVFVWDEKAEGAWTCGGASRWWLHRSLTALDEALRALGSRLLIAQGDTATELRRLAQAVGADSVHFSRRYEPAARAAEESIARAGASDGLIVRSWNAALLFEPDTVRNKSGGPFQVFTPFWRHCLTLPVEEPVAAPRQLLAPARWPSSIPLAKLGLQPRIAWDAGLTARWQPGEAAARQRLREFVAKAAEAYADRRNFPGEPGTSGLSPYLHFGEIGPRQIWAAVRASGRARGVFPPSRGAQVFLSEVGWREFAYHLLHHFPHTPEQPLRSEFAAFPWRRDDAQLSAWQRGLTGYPIVDAGMRELWHTGWMHNRVRMIVASFLVKHLRLSWREGAAWFWDTLVDADLASNTLGWQWTAGCGADAAPYFRVFNPVLQGLKFDPEGVYVRRWVPELARVPTEFLHRPWELGPLELAAADVRLGENYPAPLVDHAEARAAALAALASLRK